MKLKNFSQNNNKLQEKITKIQNEDRRSKQKEKNDEIVISNIPKNDNENLENIVQKICEKIQVTGFDISMIVNKGRMQKKSKKNNYPPKIIVKLNSVQLQNEIIKECNKMKIKGTDIDFASEDNIHINAFLIKENFDLYNYTKIILKNTNGPDFKYVWYNADGDILAKKNDSSIKIQIESRFTVDCIAAAGPQAWQQMGAKNFWGTKNSRLEEN
jgi:hypothetical protein